MAKLFTDNAAHKRLEFLTDLTYILIVYPTGSLTFLEHLMVQTRLFESNKTQAVRLSKEVAFPPDVKEVEVIRLGHSVMVSPVGKRWTDFFDTVPVCPDFERPEQLPLEDREFF
jgi:antitoxin VapB